MSLKLNPFSFSFLGNNTYSIVQCFSSREARQNYIDLIMSKTSFAPRLKPIFLFALEGILRSIKSNKDFPKKKGLGAEGFLSFDFLLPYSDRARIIKSVGGKRGEVKSIFYDFHIFCKDANSFLPSQVTQSSIFKKGNFFFYSLTLSERYECPNSISFDEGVRRDRIVGIDLNVGSLVCSSPNMQSEILRIPDALDNKIKKLEARIQRLSKKQGRRVAICKKNKTPLPKNYYKTQRDIRRDYSKISNIRNNYIHNLTSNLVRKADVLFLENLSSRRLMSRKGEVEAKSTSKKLSDKIRQSSFFKIARQIEYKAERSGRIVKFVNPYNTSKMCSKCGYINESVGLLNRSFVCPKCRNVMDRDVNASFNILNLGMRGEGVRFSLREGMYKRV